ncbi:MAG: phytoene desaturase [Ignavibacteria bacterium]|nr:phytoene desaturase [Ignavibacteria bacterium]
MKSISIIGSGLGGLSAAIRLAHNGYNVTVYEKNSYPGGKAGSVNIDGFRFDTGPSLLTMPFVIEELFSSVNENASDYLEFNKLKNLCRYFFFDGTMLNAYSDLIKFENEIAAKTIESPGTLKKFLEYCKTIYNLTSDIFLFSDLYSAKTYTNLKAFKTLFKLPKIDSFRTLNEANRSFFKDEKLIQLFNRYATYNGSNPYKCPATLNIISHVECSLGGYYLSGGMHSLTKAMYALAIKKGVKFEFNCPIEKIIINGKKVKGIIAAGKEIPSDIVISNADVFQTYGDLLNDNTSSAAKRYLKLEPSSSALVFYWGVNINSEKLDTHNILFSKDYEKEFSELFDKKIFPEDPTVYIYISSKFSPNDAPAGKENWFVMINAPNTHTASPEKGSKPTKGARSGGADYIKQTILNRIKSFTGYDISGKIECEKIMTPQDIETQTGSFGGSIYGISSNSSNAAFLRQANASKQYRGLYFTGGSAHPGGGIPLVILSGKIAAEKIIDNN